MNEVLDRLGKSKFRSSFKLNKKLREYVNDKKLDVIRMHAYDFVNTRLASSNIENDGKQTPYNHHPVFVAQHATATCCRKCLYKWHKIDINRNLTKEEIDYIVALIMAWISREMGVGNGN